MNWLWAWLSGWVEVRLTGAEPERTLRKLSERITVSQIRWENDLTVRFSILRKDWTDLQSIPDDGDRFVRLSLHGLPALAGICFAHPIIVASVCLTVLATWVLPGRIFFVCVEGNQQISAEQILEQAEVCGLYFGADRDTLRSEQIKNQLLSQMPELSWVGVNTRGCTATITVQERQTEEISQSSPPGNIVAVRDALLTSVTATAGNPLVASGDAVRKGDTLISGCTDLGFCTHIKAAQGEVYGVTQHEIHAIVPDQSEYRGAVLATTKKYAMIIGKKRINFYSDSGILHTGCGKMTKIRYLRLPGGWTLPVALVTEHYTCYETSVSARWESAVQEELRGISRKLLTDSMIAGQIRSSWEQLFHEDGQYRLVTQYECHEMIGRYSSVIFTEGDTQNDGENGERGAG